MTLTWGCISFKSATRPKVCQFLIGIDMWPWLSKLPFGRLPGDIAIQREGFSFHFPLMTSIILSIVLSLLLWVVAQVSTASRPRHFPPNLRP